MKNICVLIPCLNEEKGIAKVIKDIPIAKLKRMGFFIRTVVIDNGSTDRTKSIVKSLDTEILNEKERGKGNAVRRGFASIPEEIDYVVMLDGDNTYKSSEIPRLIEPLDSNFCDIVVGSRLSGKINKGALKTPNRVVNWFFTFLVRFFFKVNVTDVLSGFVSWRKKSLDELMPFVDVNDFSIEMEIITKAGRLGIQTYSVPITYDLREGDTKISPIRDAYKILRVLLANLFWKP